MISDPDPRPYAILVDGYNLGVYLCRVALSWELIREVRGITASYRGEKNDPRTRRGLLADVQRWLDELVATARLRFDYFDGRWIPA